MMLDRDQADAVARELRSVTGWMRAARADCPNDADALKLLLRSYGDDVVDALEPIWKLVSHIPYIPGRWEGYALNALRHKFDGRVLPTDGDAFKNEWVPGFGKLNTLRTNTRGAHFLLAV